MASPSKQTTPTVSSLASRILSGVVKNPTPAQVRTMAACVLGQDETKGQKPKKSK